jgi:hypothetical protein
VIRRVKSTLESFIVGFYIRSSFLNYNVLNVEKSMIRRRRRQVLISHSLTIYKDEINSHISTLGLSMKNYFNGSPNVTWPMLIDGFLTKLPFLRNLKNVKTIANVDQECNCGEYCSDVCFLLIE